jgi:hypothetical protein
MEFLRATLRGLLVVLTSVSLASLISIATMQATILNRNVVMQWASDSGVYNNFVQAVVQLQPAQSSESQFLGEDTLTNAIDKTLDPAFLHASTETIINSTYDWLEGKKQNIEFSIPLSEKRDQLKANLAEQIEPMLSGLPVCTSIYSGLSSQEVKCLPPNSNAKSYANDLAARSVNSSDFLLQPLTQETLKQPTLPIVNVLRFIAMNSQLIIMVLAAIALLSATGYVLLSKDKLRGVQAVGRRAFFGTLILVVGGGLLWYFSDKITLSAFGDQAIISSVIDPLARQIAADIGMWLFIFSGIIFTIGLLLWIGAILLIKRSKKKLLLAPSHPTHRGPKDLPPIDKPIS